MGMEPRVWGHLGALVKQVEFCSNAPDPERTTEVLVHVAEFETNIEEYDVVLRN
jgi:hypothetical protein